MAVSLGEAKDYLGQLDLGYIIKMMCAENYPLPRWTEIDAEHCCVLYKNFLFLQKKYPEAPLVPTREIDEFWHNHILHTMRYFTDCKQIFGFYLHHEPSGVMTDVEKLIPAYAQTKSLYLKEFGQPLGLIAK